MIKKIVIIGLLLFCVMAVVMYAEKRRVDAVGPPNGAATLAERDVPVHGEPVGRHLCVL